MPASTVIVALGVLLASVAVGGSRGSALAAPGDLDPTFSGDGSVATAVPGATHAVGSAIVRLPGGELVVAGSAGDLTSGDVVLVRYLSDGTLDGSFGVGGIARPLPGWTVAQGEVAMVRADDGAFFVAATVLAADGGDVLVARLGPDAAPDASFGDGGVRVVDLGGDDHAAWLLLDGLRRVVVAGRGGPDDELAVLRLDPDGDLDAGFGGGDGIVTTDASGGGHGSAGNDVALQSDGKIVVAGSAGNGSDLDFALVRYDEAGVPDPTFGVGGVVTTAIPPPFVGVLANDVARAVVVQPDGRIVAAGGHEWGAFEIALARYDASGALDPTFGDGGVALAGGPAEGVTANDVVLAPNGRLVVAGHVVNLQLLSLSSTVLARFMPDGTLDATFGGASGHPGLVVINRFESLFPREAGRALLRDPTGATSSPGSPIPPRRLRRPRHSSSRCRASWARRSTRSPATSPARRYRPPAVSARSCRGARRWRCTTHHEA